MELLKPMYPPHHDPTGEPISGFTSPVCSRSSVSSNSKLPGIIEEGSCSSCINTNCSNSSTSRRRSSSSQRVYLAVGRSTEKATVLLHWSFKQFGCDKDFCLLHVHQPSPLIPTLLGKLPASQANPEVVMAHRREEREKTRKLLEIYLILCHKSKVQASIETIECDLVQKGIVDLVNKHGIRKLVMGAGPENCMKVKSGSSKVDYTMKHAPDFCEIWFINKGRLMWTREAYQTSRHLPSNDAFPSNDASAKNLRSKSMQYEKNTLPVNQDFLRLSSTRTDDSFSSKLTTSASSGSNSVETRVSSDSDALEDILCCQLEELKLQMEVLRSEAIQELLKRKALEIGAVDAIQKVKMYESAHAQEVRLRKEAEDYLTITLKEQQNLLQERDNITHELQRTMRHVTLLDNCAKEGNRRHEEASGELRVLQASIASLRQEKLRIRRQKMESDRWIERWRSHGGQAAIDVNGFLGFVNEESSLLAEFSLADLQSATFDFSESFKLGEGGYGSVYKGEMLGRTVAIKKLHHYYMQGQTEFQKEVQALGRLQHPHLLTLLGASQEAGSLVYEYLPNGSLHDCLFHHKPNSNISPLTWKTRAQIISEIASALCFLHSSKPEKIVHGDLKPQNILLDSELHCKICDLGMSRLVIEDTLYCRSFGRSTEHEGSFPYTDPEFHRIRVQTPKSDIYSCGVIILQLVTGRGPVGLVGEVRRTFSRGELSSILDPLAGEWPTFVARRLVDLGLQFCESNSRDRPELTPALVKELEMLHVSEERPVPAYFLCPILQEIMHDPRIAADGHTYEGEAIREWLQNGHDTSPMTNLRLDHLELTPNHSLRLAIQDWLCRT